MSPVQIWVLAFQLIIFTLTPSLNSGLFEAPVGGLQTSRSSMPLPIPDKPGQVFANADSFAMVFDEAWQKLDQRSASRDLTLEEKKRLVMEACADHPFLLSQPTMAEQVAVFRIRLLGL